MPSVVLLSPTVPAREPRSAGHLFLARYAQGLARRGWHVTVVGPWLEHAQGPPLDSSVAGLITHHGGEATRARRALLEGPTWLLDLARAPTLPPLALRAVLRRPSVRRAIADADVVEIHFGQARNALGAVRRLAPGARVTAFEHDVLIESFERRRHAGTRWRRTADRVRLASARRREPAYLAAVDRVAVFSERDRDHLRALGVRTPIDVSGPYVEIPAVPPVRRPGLAVGFVGPLWRPENADGVTWFLDRVWPLVRRAHPTAVFRVAGEGPALPPTDGLDQQGYVEDLSSFLAETDVFVAPLTLGAGVSFKVVQAFAHQLPVVATPIAAEGIVAASGSSCFGHIGDEPGPFAAAVIDLLADPEQARAVGAAARRWVEDHVDFERVLDDAERRLRG